jgi:hypothetical protein
MRNRALQQSERLGNQAEQQIGQNSEIARQKAAALKPLREQELAQASQPLPQPPQSQPLPPVPSNQMSDADNAWLNAAMFLGSLAGGLTRNHVTNALAGMTGAVEGYTQGRKDLFQQQMDIWKAANDRALKENDRSQKAYEAVLQNRQLSMQQKMMQIQITAAQFDDEAMAGAAAQKDTLAVAQLADQRAARAADMGKASVALDGERGKMAEQEVAQSPQVTKAMAEGRERWPTGSSGYGGMLARARVQAILALNPEAKETDFARNLSGERYAGTAQQREQFTSDTTRIRGWTRIEETMKKSQGVALSHLEELKDLTGRLGNGDINVINYFKQEFQAQTGNPAPTDFDAAKEIVGDEVVKAILGGQSSSKDRENLKNTINRARSPEQLDSAIEVYQRLMAGQMLGLKRQYDFAHQGVKAPAFEEGLDDNAKRLIPLLQERRPIFEKKELAQELDRIFGETQSRATEGATGFAKAVTFPNYKAGQPYSTPAQGVKEGRQGTGVKWTPDWLTNALPEGWRVK